MGFPVHTAALPEREQLQALIAALGRGLLERDAAVRLVLLAALAGEHVLLLGVPGTAKSALARRLHHAIQDARYFERLLTRFSTPEELFGPLSLRALEHDRYERLIDGFLPTAGVAFLDEVFKANSAILNALLTLLNERQFDNGTERLDTPLVCVIAASNELPADEALQAFHDRFLLRIPVSPVSDAGFVQLLQLPDDADRELPMALSARQRAAVGDAAAQVALGADFLDGCQQLRGWLAQRHVAPSDRRWRRFVALARVAAACERRGATDALDLWLAQYVAAPRPEDVAALQAWFVDVVLATPPAAAPWLQKAVEAFERQLEIERTMPDPADADAAGKLALARAIGLGAEGSAVQGEAAAQRIVSARLEASLQRRWSSVHVAARVAQVQQIEEQVAQDLARRRAARTALDARLRDRLWIAPDLRSDALARHDAGIAVLLGLASRLAAARTGFSDLPRDDAAGEGARAPESPWSFEA